MKTARSLTIIISLVLILILTPILVFAQSVGDLNQQISDKEQEIQDIKKKASVYQKNIRVKQEEAASLKNQLIIIENQIAKTELDIEVTQAEVAQTQLEQREVELQVITKEDTIDNQKRNLGTLIQQIHQNDNTNQLKIFALNDSISDYFNEVEYTKELQKGLSDALTDLKQEKKELLNQKQELEAKQIQLVKLKQDLQLNQVNLAGETKFKENVLIQTENSEKKFTELFWQAKDEQESISADLTSLEKKVRSKLNELKEDKPELRNSQLMWPVPKNKITSTFHDPDYPFRYLFEHPAIDVRAAQGTTIRAPAEGYVLKTKDAGMGYSYIALIHANGLSTVYGHVSKILVREDEYVSQGEVIGYSGGMPGTPGAGRLTSGPHLHFEVRMNGIPVNPLDYLP
ncbi:peptidoglycan DD-metalloendopeptidase family protein [Candidatus Falkowbacteria bacterium]|jgi:murein DD-endopeptidase MepM/ murein hydrolase activator NlpD|nr:peptidoglycan DD-metalloendopeptidase family protein [Candidatus Falkowbacteria bacterium]MBT5502691.1 peptidoglycan DD-metalloendopeptidase family protein [Candidatus Falkowbacteria bacterium]MBT6573525.1 peptidoglycan DD-metalloendopeptidase family protein [Candidatus Falkowbacteria bacterium]MBT7348075.1 peptidoglycan DD-metalloendopeptidase family protein [Candidatus Falkowbacteria bacterium]MBT7501090.1 peptidoglycan DD-metalloendopeptidase family protein [Candidatus Falkowbacteria bact